MLIQRDERQLPYGVADLFGDQAARKVRAESLFRAACAGWGYGEVIPPTFEYFETLAAQASAQVREETYRFFDRDGRTLALRADPTLPIARLAATKLANHPLPLRLFYVASVFRYEEPKAANRREFTQAGVELIGAGSPAADAEILALAVETVRAMGLPGMRLRLGHVGLLHALLDAAALSSGGRANLYRALERKASHLMAATFQEEKVEGPARAALEALPTWTGDAGVVDAALRLCAGLPAAEAALLSLRETVRYLVAFDVLDEILLDLGMARGMEYYTGMIFEGFAPRLGFGLVSGGRYDRLIAHYGRDLPAVGFAIGVERLLAALDEGALPVSTVPEVLAETTPRKEWLAQIRRARAQGLRVELAPPEMSRGDLHSLAAARGAREVWYADGVKERVG